MLRVLLKTYLLQLLQESPPDLEVSASLLGPFLESGIAVCPAFSESNKNLSTNYGCVTEGYIYMYIYISIYGEYIMQKTSIFQHWHATFKQCFNLWVGSNLTVYRCLVERLKI